MGQRGPVRPHAQCLTPSGSWELPVGKGKRYSLGPGNWVLGDWKISGIYTLTSGRTSTVYGYNGGGSGNPYGYDQVGTYGGWSSRYRANINGSPTSGFTQSPAEWFNTSVFSAPQIGTYGDSGKGILRRPYFEDLDLAFSKGFSITERQKLQFRAEIFNAGSNWHALNDFGASNLIPGNNVGGCNFGSLAGIGCDAIFAGAHLWNPRRLQLSLVYSF